MKAFLRGCLISLIMVFTECSKDPSLWKIENLNGNRISVFGHEGMGSRSRFPMDSYESLKQCLSLRPDGVEIDVRVTKDSVPVFFHDEEMEDGTTCQGMIKNKNWDEIKDCKYTSSFLKKYDLISAAYFFDRISDKNDFIYSFECKLTLTDDTAYLNSFANAILRHIYRYGLESNCFIESFNIVFLKILATKNKDLKLFLYPQDYQTGLRALSQVNLYGLVMDVDKISKEEIKIVHGNNLRVTLFNVRTEQKNRDAIEKNPDFIQTDQLDYLIKIFGKNTGP